MTQAELLSLCTRHGIDAREGAEVLDMVVTKLLPSRPDGIGLPPHAVGSVMEIVAHLNDAIWETRPFRGGELYATAEKVIAFFRHLAGA